MPGGRIELRGFDLLTLVSELGTREIRRRHRDELPGRFEVE